jgi:hypothetical protein
MPLSGRGWQATMGRQPAQHWFDHITPVKRAPIRSGNETHAAAMPSVAIWVYLRETLRRDTESRLIWVGFGRLRHSADWV